MSALQFTPNNRCPDCGLVPMWHTLGGIGQVAGVVFILSMLFLVGLFARMAVGVPIRRSTSALQRKSANDAWVVRSDRTRPMPER